MAEATEGRSDGQKVRATLLLLVHVALVVGAVAAFAGARYHGPTRNACPAVLGKDGLVDLSLRAADAQQAQLRRWQDCDPGAAGRAVDAVRNDWWLIGTLLVAFGLAVVLGWRRRRWRLAAIAGGVLAATYVVAAVVDNLKLLDLLEHESFDNSLRWYAAVKFGAFAGALPLLLVSFADAVGQFFAAREKDPEVRAADAADRKRPVLPEEKRRPSTRVAGFVRRWWARITTETPPALVDDGADEGTTPAEAQVHAGGDTIRGVCCSGGGIRSAAFNLGALQALDEHKRPDGGGELDAVQWISAVSGGSYLAAAWVTSRAEQQRKGERRAAQGHGPSTPAGRTWSRGSPEEDHLRRHASYMAPGLGGKLWALARFLFGFLLNVGVITLFLGVVFLPFGWLVDRYERGQSVAVAGTVDLPRGGCLELSDGRRVTALPGSSLRLDAGARPQISRDAPAEAPVKKGAVAVGGVAPSDGPTTAAPPTTLPRSAACPARDQPPVEPGVPADVVNGKLESRTRVRLQLDQPLPVKGSFPGCLTSGGAPDVVCRPAGTQFLANPGARLFEAPGAMLTLGRSAVVDEGHFLARACGSVACERFALPSPLEWLVRALAALTLLFGISLVIARATKGTVRRTERWARRLALLALVAWVVCDALPWLVVWTENGRWGIEHRLRVTSTTGTLAVLGALLVQVAPFLGARSRSTSEAATGRVAQVAKRAGAKLRPVIVRLAGAVVGPLVVLVSAVGFASYAAQHQWSPGQVGLWLGLAGPLALLLAGADLNEWSLHPYYRDRLRTAFAVDPRANPPEDPREDPMAELPATGPQLLICAAVNIADERVTAPGRPVASWVFSRTEMGSAAMGKAPTPGLSTTTGVVPLYCLPAPYEHLAWTWTAVAVSGAAFSPAMGKMSRPEGFLLALGNLRLGVWYPNPRYLANADETWWYAIHHPRPWYLAKEALGLHRADDRWVYVTDGGHYENLGLVELLRRGCREIYCFDASGDRAETFGTVADAMRLAREELNVEVRLTPSEKLKPDKDGVSEVGVWAGTVHYPTGRPGWLVLAKLAVPATAPFDVIDLARTLPSFPNHPTADQLYTDQKFEAYRALGHHLGEQAAALADEIRRFLASDDDVDAAVATANSRLS